jgi:hypothetical protein
VHFEEIGTGVGRRLGTAKGSRGTLRFSPGDGPRGKRRIVALVEQSGNPRENIDVASYTAPAPARPARPAGLKATRKGSRVTVTWRPARRAARYLVRAKLSDGRNLLFFATSKRRSVRISGIASGTTARITVAGLKPDGTAGPAGTVKLAKKRKRR